MNTIKSNEQPKNLKLIVEGLIFLFVESLSRAIPLILLPIVAVRYSQNEMALYSKLLLFTSYSTSIINLSSYSYVNIIMGKHHENIQEQKYWIRTLIQTSVILSFLISISLIIIQYIFKPIIFDKSILYILLICFAGISQSLFSAAGAYFRALNNKLKYFLLNITNLTIFSILLFIITIKMNAKVWSIIFTMSGGLFLSSIIMLMIDPKIAKVSTSIKTFYKELLSYSYLVTINDSVNLTASNISRIVLITEFGSSALAPYQVALTLSQIISTLSQIYNMIVIPKFFSAHFGKKDIKVIDPLYLPIASSIVIAAMLILFSNYYTNILFAGKYNNINQYLLFPILSSCILPLYFIMTNILSIDKIIIRYKTLMNIIIAAVSIGFAVALSKIFGLTGALLATPLSGIIGLAANYYIMNKRTNYNVPLKLYLFYIAICIALIQVINEIIGRMNHPGYDFILRVIGFLVIVMIQYAFYYSKKRLVYKGAAFNA